LNELLRRRRSAVEGEDTDEQENSGYSSLEGESEGEIDSDEDSCLDYDFKHSFFGSDRDESETESGEEGEKKEFIADIEEMLKYYDLTSEELNTWLTGSSDKN